MSGLVAVTPYGNEAASTRVRVFDWLYRLAPDTPIHAYAGTRNNSPLTLLAHPLAVIGAGRDLRALASSSIDRLLLHRAASPFGSGDLEARLLGAARWRVYDFDDALQWDPGRSVTSLLGSNATKCIRCIKAADRVVAGNDVLAEWAGQFARNVTVVPSCVDPFGYRMKQTYELADPPRLVWIGSHSAEKYLRLFAEAFLEIHRRTSARLTIVGQSHGRLGPLEIMTDRVPWKDGLAEQALCEFDVGVGPLNDDVLSRGKCAYKLLQYGAAGLPLVASPVGANATVGTALGGRLAGCVDEWVDQLAELLSASASYRREVGILARKCVEDSYSFNAWTDRWSAALELDVRDTSSVVR